MFEAKRQKLFFLFGCVGDFCVRKSLLALKAACLSYIGISGGNLSEKKWTFGREKFSSQTW